MAFRPAHFTRRALEAMLRGPYVTLTGTGTIFVAVLVTGLFAGALAGGERLLAAWARTTEVVESRGGAAAGLRPITTP